jgi:hypothetical protein
VDPEVVEQRILEQSVRLPACGAVTAWAALRWRGAAFFDGLQNGSEQLPVPLVVSGAANIRSQPGSAVTREQLAPSEREMVSGMPCTTIQRALFDEMRRGLSLRHAVVSLDMAAAAKLISVALMSEYVAQRPAWTGVPLVRRALLLASEDSRSPQETRMRLVWTLDADLPAPLCNQPVFGTDGQLLGYPDLFDPVAGLVGEYDGANHLERDRRRSDAEREARFRDHGLEYVNLVRGDLGDRARAVRRICSARARAPFTRAEDRRWTLTMPSWFQPEEPLDAYLVRTGAAGYLTHT